MNNLFSVNWWISMFVSTAMTMVFIWLIKKATSAVNIPVVSEIAASV